MKPRTRINLTLMGVAFAVGIGFAVMLLREPTELLTPGLLQAAWQRWDDRGPSDYDFHYRMHGSVYEVKSRGGVVVEVSVNGQRPRTNDYSVYGVEGIFETLEQELENFAESSKPGLRNTKTVLLRVRFNHEYGYPERYLRSSGTHGRGVTIELIEFIEITQPTD